MLKTHAERLGVETVERRSGMLNFKFHEEARVQPAKLMALVAGTMGAQFTPAGILRGPLYLRGSGDPALVLERWHLFMARWRVQTRSPRDVSDPAQWSDAGLEPRMKAHIDAAIERCFDRDFVRAVRAEWL